MYVGNHVLSRDDVLNSSTPTVEVCCSEVHSPAMKIKFCEQSIYKLSRIDDFVLHILSMCVECMCVRVCVCVGLCERDWIEIGIDKSLRGRFG